MESANRTTGSTRHTQGTDAGKYRDRAFRFGIKSVDKKIQSVQHWYLQRLDAGKRKYKKKKCGCRFCVERSCRLGWIIKSSKSHRRRKSLCNTRLSIGL